MQRGSYEDDDEEGEDIQENAGTSTEEEVRWFSDDSLCETFIGEFFMEELFSTGKFLSDL